VKGKRQGLHGVQVKRIYNLSQERDAIETRRERGDSEMTYEDLVQSMEASAQEKIAEIRRNADLQSETIVKEAEGRAQAIREEILARARATLADKRNRLLYKTKQDERSADIETREEILEKVYKQAAAQLERFRMREDYRSLFSRLLAESLGEMEEGGIVLHVDPRDETLCREILVRMGRDFPIIPDITTWGGVIVSSPDEQVRIHNTLEARLERAKNLYKKEVCRILFGE